MMLFLMPLQQKENQQLAKSRNSSLDFIGSSILELPRMVWEAHFPSFHSLLTFMCTLLFTHVIPAEQPDANVCVPKRTLDMYMCALNANIRSFYSINTAVKHFFSKMLCIQVRCACGTQRYSQ